MGNHAHQTAVRHNCAIIGEDEHSWECIAALLQAVGSAQALVDEYKHRNQSDLACADRFQVAFTSSTVSSRRSQRSCSTRRSICVVVISALPRNAAMKLVSAAAVAHAARFSF